MPTSIDRLSELLGTPPGELVSCLSPLGQAEDEIEKARQRHPGAADRIWHSFGLLYPTHRRMLTEFVFRSHCRELLDRSATGSDTRAGTAAEVCCSSSETSLSTMNPPAVGLYLRMWEAAGFPELDAHHGVHYEARYRSAIDDLERTARDTLSRADRTLGRITCGGTHHGDRVSCVYAEPNPRTRGTSS